MLKTHKKVTKLQKTIDKTNEIHDQMCAQVIDVMNELQAVMKTIYDKGATESRNAKLFYWMEQYKCTLDMLRKYNDVLELKMVHIQGICSKGTETINNLESDIKQIVQ